MIDPLFSHDPGYFEDPQTEGAADITERIESAAVVAGQPADVILWDVESMMPSDDAPTLLFGPPGALKSWIALHLCNAIVTRQRFLGRFNVRTRPSVLYVNIDAGPKSFRNRIRRVSNSACFDFISISSTEFTLGVLRKLMAGYQGGFVVLDCWSAIFNPDRTLDAAFAMREFVDTLRNIYTEFDCGGLGVDHPHRPKEIGTQGDYHGSVQKEASFRSMWQLNAVPPDDSGGPRRTKITCRKLSEGQPFPAVHAVIDFSDERISFSTAYADPAAREATLEAKIIEWAQRQTETFSKNSIEKASLGYRVVDVRRTVADLIDRAVLVAAGTRGSGTTYRLADVVPHVVPDHVVPIRNRDGTTWPDLGHMPMSSQSCDVVPESDDMEATDGSVFD